MIIPLMAAILLISLGARGRYSSIWKNRSGVLTYSRGNVNISNGALAVSGALTVGSGSTLLSSTTVALNADADTVLYTVPAGKRCVLTHAILVAGADAVGSDISIGAAGAETDFVPATDLQHLDAQYDAVILQPIPAIEALQLKSYAATTVIEAKVTNQAGGATNTLYLFGFLY